MNNDLIPRHTAIVVLETLKEIVEFHDPANVFVSDITDALDVIRNMKDVDAVEVVRCKDCKHWGTGYGGETEHCKVCEYAGYMVGANGYCVYGERKMDAEVEG